MKNTQKLISPLLCISGLLLFSACGDLPGFSVDPKTDSYSQIAVRNDKIDILFVVDNSGSMAEEQQNMTDSFDRFIEAFASKNLNFHVGVISTDVLENASYWASTGSFTSGPYKNFPHNVGPGSLLSYQNNDKFLTSKSVNYIDQFKQSAKLGLKGNGAETGVLSAMKALSSDLLGPGKWNEGFVRSEAFLSIIFMSDEDESMSSTNNAYLKTDPTARQKRVDDFSAQMKALKPGHEKDLLRVDAIVAPSIALCPTLNYTNNVPGTGDVYMQLATAFNGKTANLCQDFSQDLIGIGNDLVRLLTRFKLVQVPDSAIEVRVDGEVVPQDETNGWTFIKETQEIEFRGTAIPNANAQITLTYVPGAPLE